MQIKKLAAKFLAAVLAASILTGFAALPLDASNEAQTLDYDALNQTLEEYKATGRANSIENLDAQLSAGQIDQATYNTQKGYVCLAQGNATVANLPVLDTYLDRVVEQMNGTPKDQANECLGNVPKSDIASEVFAGAGLGSFRFLTSVWYGKRHHLQRDPHRRRGAGRRLPGLHLLRRLQALYHPGEHPDDGLRHPVPETVTHPARPLRAGLF